ncbi:MAG: Smr/MutS family protein [Lentisphaerota bacterium]
MVKKKKHNFNYDFTLDLHGKNLEDSIYELEKNIYSGKLSSIMIIHGHGEGILRNGIRKYVSECKFVREVMYGENLNMPGTSAITIIYL